MAQQTGSIDLKATKKAHDDAKKIAEDMNQYFWHTEEGTDTGAHITKIPQEDFIADPEHGGGNLLARSNGIAVRDGLTELATFGEEVIIGEDGKAHAVIDYHSMRIIDKTGDPIFNVIDLVNDYSDVTYEITGDGVTTDWSKAIGGIPSWVSLVDENGQEVSYSSYLIASIDNPPNGVIIRISPTLPDKYVATIKLDVIGRPSTPSFTFGSRTDEFQGFYSFTEGEGNAAAADYSHAQNYHTKANGFAQTAIGRWNETGNSFAFMIGNGQADNARSNALTVDWNGNVEAAGDITDGSGNVLSEKADQADLDGKAQQGTWDHYVNVTLTHNSTSGNMYLWRWGPLVVCQLTGIWNIKTANTLTTMSGTVPSGYRPAGTRYFGVTPVTNNSPTGYSRWDVQSNGTVRFVASATGNREMRQMVCWVTQDDEPS